MWSGSIASIPVGWQLADGTNGSPDLRNRFIVGAGSDTGIYTGLLTARNSGNWASGQTLNYISLSTGYYAPGAVGGSDAYKLIVDELPSFTVSFPYANVLAAGPTMGAIWGTNVVGYYHMPIGADKVFDHRPSYYALVYIIKL